MLTWWTFCFSYKSTVTKPYSAWTPYAVTKSLNQPIFSICKEITRNFTLHLTERLLSKGVLNGDKSGIKSRRKEGEKEKKANERREKWKIFLNLITNMPYNKIFWRHERNRFKYIVTFVPSTRLQVWAIQHLLEKHAYIFQTVCCCCCCCYCFIFPVFFFLRLTYHLKWWLQFVDFPDCPWLEFVCQPCKKKLFSIRYWIW